MKDILVDSSILIDFLRQENKKDTLFFNLTQNYNQIFISIITHAELHSGRGIWEKSKVRFELKKLLEGIEILPLKVDISEKAGKIRAKYGINLLDAIIAATAILTKLDFVTLNIKDFKMIRGLKLLKI